MCAAAGPGVHGEAAAGETDAFLHAGEAEAVDGWVEVRREAGAVVADGQADAAVGGGE